VRFSERPILDPYSMTGTGALALLAETAALLTRDEY
jgi:hypothetical protein